MIEDWSEASIEILKWYFADWLHYHLPNNKNYLIANDFILEEFYPVDYYQQHHDFVIICPKVAPTPAFMQCAS